MEYLNKISDEEVKLLPKVSFEGEVEVIEDFREQNIAADYLLSHTTVIGFDTESRASFKKGVINKIALLQLSGAGRAYLIRVNRVKLSQGIIKLLESPKHIKVGVALKEDVKELRSITDFEPKGFLDLQRVVGDFNIGELGLKKMSAIVLGVQISKAQRLSNWEATTLTESQIRYAATDAWISEQIFLGLNMNEATLKKGLITYNNKLEAQQKALARERRRLLRHRQTEEE